MKTRKALYIFLFFVTFYISGYSQTSYEITTWYQNKQCAISFTFDDGYSSQLIKAANILSSKNYKGTFFIITNQIGHNSFATWEDVIRAAGQGHEIGSHTVNHPTLTELSADSCKKELKLSKEIIDKKVTGQKCITMAYPRGACNANIEKTVSEIYIAARGTGEWFSLLDRNMDFYNILTHPLTTETPLTKWNSFVDAAYFQKQWLVELIHGLDSNGYSPVLSKNFIKHLDYIKTNDEKIWVAPFKDVVRYIKEKAASKITSVKVNKQELSFELTGNLPDNIYDFPLTLKIKIPENWSGIKSVTLDETKIPFITEEYNDNKYFLINIAPNKGTIKVKAL